MPSKSTINITFKLDGDSKGFKDLASQADGLKVVMQSAAVEAEKFQSSIINWSQGVQALGAVSSAVSNLNNSLTALTGESMAFSKAMTAANTMAGRDTAGFKELKDQVADLAKTIPIARDELAQGLYQVISNGVPEDNWISFLEASARSSVGGIANLGEAVTVTSTIIKNYGLAWEDAQAVQDKLQLTAKKGVTTFEQLAGALPSVAGSAATLGVSIEELMSVFATCTGVTGNTAEVSTQLNAVLKALIKPTSEATAAADKMGIAFNAAAVKEAGGLDNFLKSVDAAIKDYSARTGELSETIYGNLFGSSRALRLLTSLTGEQSAKFTENIATMVDSAGTMDAAYEQMSNTVSAQSQLFQNYVGSLMDVVAGVIAPYQPIVNLTAQLGQMSLGILTLTRSMGAMRGGAVAMATNLKTLVAGVGLLTTAEGRAAIATQGFGNAARTAAVGMSALQVAVRGLLIASGVGAAIAALTLLIDKLGSSAKKASTQVDDFATAQDAFKDTTARVQGEINTEVSKLNALIKSNGDASKTVEELNNKYGAIFGTYDTAAEWKDVLIQKSKDYVTQLGYEAMALEAGQRLARAQTKLNEAQKAQSDIEASGRGRTYTPVMGMNGMAGSLVETISQEAHDAQKAVEAADAEVQAATADLDKAQKGATECAARVSAIAPAAQKVSTNIEKIPAAMGRATTAVQQQKTRYQELSDLISAATEAYTTQSGEEQEATRKQIAAWQQERQELELLQAEAQRPLGLESMRDYDTEIAYQQKLRATASKENIAAIDAEIERLKAERDAFQGIVEAVEQPVDLAMVKNIQECTDAIDYYSNLQKTASADEYTDLQKTINAYQAKADAIQRGSQLLDMQGEVNSLNGLSTRELRIKVRADGYDSFVDKINDLRAMLADEVNPVSPEQAEQINELIDAYSRLGVQAAMSFDTLQRGWSSIKGMGNGVEDITDALTGNGNAWERVTSIIDGFIEIYNGISTVISIIEALTGASIAHGAAKTAEGVETEAEAGLELAAAGEQAAAAAITIPANEAEATSWKELAAARIFAAHASIPFAGVPIASGFVAAMEGVLSSIQAFASGGIAYGPTLGLFGEYAGASSNPEVVAPLDRLRSLLKTEDEMSGGRVRFTIEGRTLVGVLEREYAVRNRR